MDDTTVRSRPWLLMDVSNQRTKWLTWSDGEPGEVRVVATNDVADLFEVVSDRFSGLVMASVVPTVAAAVEARCAAGDVAVVRANPALVQALGLMDFSGYEGRQTIGEDRVANIIGATASAKSNAVMAVDLGTATTIEVAFCNRGRWKFSGGMIAPGVNALGRYLHEKTAQLPMVNPASIDETVTALGQTTRGAIAGALKFGYPAMIAGMVKAAMNECDGAMDIVVTGGAADFFPWTDFPEAIRDEFLTLRGLARLIETR
jgi:pantothenate kinase type III